MTTKKGKRRMESPGNEGDHQDDEVVDWDKKETQLALFNSWFVPFLFLKYIYIFNFIFSHNTIHTKDFAEGSSHKIIGNNDINEDPFVNVIPTNSMPAPPKAKSNNVLLEDFENFTVRC